MCNHAQQSKAKTQMAKLLKKHDKKSEEYSKAFQMPPHADHNLSADELVCIQFGTYYTK